MSLPILFVAPAGAEQPNAPRLTGTAPESPSTALRPLIQGNAEEEVIISGADLFSEGVMTSAAEPVTMATEHPEYMITIYSGDPTCQEGSAIVATGEAKDLEGAGILVESDVSKDATTTFFAKQTDPTDPGNPSECSKGLAYRQVTTPPGQPVLTSVTPDSPSNNNFPQLGGESDPEAIVSIYDTADCKGAVRGQGTGAEFLGAGIAVSVPNNSTTTFYAKATLGGLPSPCSASSVIYQEVTPPEENPGEGGGGGGGGGTPQEPIPDVPGKPQSPKLRVTPNGPANDNTPRVTGSAPGAVTVKVFGNADCKGTVLVQGSAAELAAGFPLQVPNDTVVVFYAVSIDSGGDRSPCSPEPTVYVEDSTAPRTRITSGPGVKTFKRKVIFRFADINGDVATSFVCKLDKRKWRPCQAPLRLRKLGRKRHVVRVKGVDAAGNREGRGAKRSFKVIGRRR
ncbi:MAG: hypothetical protein WD827_05795 [Solirubrobacterales bacterium]